MHFTILGLLVSLYPLHNLSDNLVKTTAIHDAKLYTEAISEFRTVYTSEVVSRVKSHGIEISHDYINNKKQYPYRLR